MPVLLHVSTCSYLFFDAFPLKLWNSVSQYCILVGLRDLLLLNRNDGTNKMMLLRLAYKEPVAFSSSLWITNSEGNHAIWSWSRGERAEEQKPLASSCGTQLGGRRASAELWNIATAAHSCSLTTASWETGTHTHSEDLI